MSGNNLTGADIGSYGEVVHGDQIGRQYNISLTQVPGWLEAEKEIQQILKDVSDTSANSHQSDRSTTQTAIQAIQRDPKIRARVIGALQEGAKEALKQLYSHPAAEVAIAAFDGFTKNH